MKKIFFIIAGFLVSVSLFAQVQTTISGRITNNQDGSSIQLTTNTFGLQTMTDDIKTLDQTVTQDSVFLLTTDKITRPNTICWLVVNNEFLKVVLSPGDSIHVETDYWSMNNSVEFSGNGPGKNRYLKLYGLRFAKTNRLENIKSQDYHYPGHLKSYRLDEESLLNSCLGNGMIDSSFYEMESARIRYEYCDNLLCLSRDRPFRDSETISAIRAEISRTDLSDTVALVTFPEYRSLITKYIGFLADSTGRQSSLGLQG
ncbi:MAG: hypothetical protein NTV01_19315, partial [Bacteroidia bacterium]|nr:hypothetical protein [Bacteroidia bacterium]